MGRKERGSRTHGGGSQKKGRGAGNRGGRGKAGAWKHEKYPVKRKGKYGFKRPQAVQDEAAVANIGDIDENIEALVEDGIAKERGDAYVVDLEDLGVDKLLGSGQVRNKLEIKVDDASESAVEKVEEAGGKVEA